MIEYTEVNILVREMKEKETFITNDYRNYSKVWLPTIKLSGKFQMQRLSKPKSRTWIPKHKRPSDQNLSHSLSLLFSFFYFLFIYPTAAANLKNLRVFKQELVELFKLILQEWLCDSSYFDRYYWQLKGIIIHSYRFLEELGLHDRLICHMSISFRGVV